MEERFPDEFVTWHHKTYVGIKIDEVFGMDSKTGRVWESLAKQIYSEQGGEYYPVIEHFENGVPYLEGYPGRISVTHSAHLLVVAALPKTPEVNLEEFNLRSAMGVDAESLQREQVLKIRHKFLSEDELKMIPEDDVRLNVLAWTAKEALYKATLGNAKDFCREIKIHKLPVIQKDPLKGSEEVLGLAYVTLTDKNPEEPIPMKLYSYESYGCAVTLAFSPKCARYGGK